MAENETTNNGVLNNFSMQYCLIINLGGLLNMSNNVYEHVYRMLPSGDMGPTLPQFNSYSVQHTCYQNSFNNLKCLTLPNDVVTSNIGRRNFFSFSAESRKREFLGRKLVGFSMEEMFDVVSDVNSYKDFLPFCKKSSITMHENERMMADLVIGFPPVVEKYTSYIRYARPSFIMAESREAFLFDHLVTNWKFSPGLSNNPRSCVINFYVSFEFKSMLHSQLANMFFNELVKQMESAFYTEAVRRYGVATVPMLKLKAVPGSQPNSSDPTP